MTDTEIIETLATRVMGWEKAHTKQDCWMGEMLSDGLRAAHWDWNPLRDWNHWREIEEYLYTQHSLLFWAYLKTPYFNPTEAYITTPLHIRCIALINALDSLPKKYHVLSAPPR
jgi:hypothetical protein